VSLVTLVRSYVFTWRNYASPAWYDLWIWVEDFRLWVEHRYRFHDLIKFHYDEHRIATTRLLLLLDSIFFHMSGHSIAVFNLLLLAAAGLMLWRLVRMDTAQNAGWNAPPLFWVALLASVCQVDNLILPFQVQFAIICALACAAAGLLSQAAAAERTRAAWLAAAAGLLSIAADFTMASGVLLSIALLLLLALRRARPMAWAVYTPLSALGLALFFHHRPQGWAPLPLFNGHLIVVRALYVGNFLASSLGAFPHVAAFAGLCALAVFLALAGLLLRAYTFKGLPLPSGDAALTALAVFVVLCGPAGTLTVRLFFGASAALVPRYATMSLLFTAALAGLFLRWGARTEPPARVGNVLRPAALIVVLLVMNLPAYDAIAARLDRSIAADAGLLVNNVGVEGPIPVIIGGTIDDIRADVAFLHAHRLNMFAPESGLPPTLLAQLHRVDAPALPVCRGVVDDAYAIDDAGFLLSGWAADADGRRSASWIAAIDAHGAVLGTARALSDRPDVAAALHMTGPGRGFDDGFRLAAPLATDASADLPRDVRVLALFPGARQPICRLVGPAHIGPLQIEPAARLRDLAPAASTGAPDSSGFAPWTGTPGGPPAAAPDGVSAWGWAAQSHADQTGMLRFHVSRPAGDGRALVLPFAMAEASPGRRAAFIMADGARFEIDLPSLWARPAWRAVALPATVLARHAGPVTVEVQAKGDTWLAVGAPLLATLQPEWSRLF
jgi:hypothetical protein